MSMNFYYTEASNVYTYLVIDALKEARANVTNTHLYDGSGTAQLYYVDEYSNNIEKCEEASELGQLLLRQGQHVSVNGEFPDSFQNYVNRFSPAFLSSFNNMFNSISNIMTQWKTEHDTDAKNISSAYVNLMKTIYLRDVYRSGWEPDPEETPDEKMYIITTFNGVLYTAEAKQCNNYLLSFQTRELRDTFLGTHYEIINSCKDLI